MTMQKLLWLPLLCIACIIGGGILATVILMKVSAYATSTNEIFSSAKEIESLKISVDTSWRAPAPPPLNTFISNAIMHQRPIANTSKIDNKETILQNTGSNDIRIVSRPKDERYLSDSPTSLKVSYPKLNGDQISAINGISRKYNIITKLREDGILSVLIFALDDGSTDIEQISRDLSNRLDFGDNILIEVVVTHESATLYTEKITNIHENINENIQVRIKYPKTK